MENEIRWIKSQEVIDPVLKSWIEIGETSVISKLIPNAATEVRCLQACEEFQFPVTINHAESGNSYVVSMYNAYAVYAAEELHVKVSNSLVRKLILPIISGLARYLRWVSIDNIIHVNNFVLSTNPYPGAWKGEGIAEICGHLRKEFPKHLVVFRSVNTIQHDSILKAAEQNHMKFMVSRQIYFFDPNDEKIGKHNNSYQDKRIIKRSGLHYVSHEEMYIHLDQAHLLYCKLYIEKYSRHNPQYTLEYLQLCHRKKMIYFQGYKDDTGMLRSFAGLFIYGNTITSPLVGYDTGAPLKEGLYIHAIQLILETSLTAKTPLNFSSGASKFKKLRGAVPVLEYSLIDDRHLPIRTRFIISLLALFSNRIGKPILQKYEL